MKKYTNTDPVFSEEIDIYESTDPVDADSVDNVPLKQLHDNTVANRNHFKEAILKLSNRLQELEDLVRRLFAFSYDGEDEAIVAGNEDTSYADGTVVLPDDLAEYEEDSGTVTLSGSPGGGGGGAYILPVATATRLGGVRIGSGISSQSDGTISVDAESTAEAAAGIIEATATSPTDEQIDSLWPQ